MARLGVIMVSMGEPTEKYAIESVKYQTRQPDEFVIVRNTSPISSACNLGYKTIKTDWVLEIGSDFILKPDALKLIEPHLIRQEGWLGCLFAKLWDTWRQMEIASFDVYNRKAMEEIGYYRDVPDTDVDVHKRLRKAGYAVVQTDRVMGLHNHHFTQNKYLKRQWNEGKMIKSPLQFAYSSKCSVASFRKTGIPVFVFSPIAQMAGFFLGKREDVKA